jgi:hypothetical protein
VVTMTATISLGSVSRHFADCGPRLAQKGVVNAGIMDAQVLRDLLRLIAEATTAAVSEFDAIFGEPA